MECTTILCGEAYQRRRRKGRNPPHVSCIYDATYGRDFSIIFEKAVSGVWRLTVPSGFLSLFLDHGAKTMEQGLYSVSRDGGYGQDLDIVAESGRV